MQVKPSQLVPGCILLKDVVGKTKYSIIPKRTIITEKHIEILKGFLVESVEVDTKLANGERFTPILDAGEEESKGERTSEVDSPFMKEFLEAVHTYKQIYNQIISGIQLDILKVRNFIIPLLDRTEEVDGLVKKIHMYGNKKEYIYYHSVSVAVLSSFLARKLGYKRSEWIQVGLAGLLSDLGMAKVDQNIVFYGGSLTKNQMDQIKLHPTYSYHIVKDTPGLSSEVKLAILQHHERFDGSGYPLKVKVGKIHDYAQIIAICDVYHAIVSERIYRGKQSPYRALEELNRAKFQKFNATMVIELARTIANFQINDKVKLSDKRYGKIIYVDPNNPIRPMVAIENSDEIVNLRQTTNVYIDEVL